MTRTDDARSAVTQTRSSALVTYGEDNGADNQHGSNDRNGDAHFHYFRHSQSLLRRVPTLQLGSRR
jgi:hypothetical protein